MAAAQVRAVRSVDLAADAQRVLVSEAGALTAAALTVQVAEEIPGTNTDPLRGFISSLGSHPTAQPPRVRLRSRLR